MDYNELQNKHGKITSDILEYRLHSAFSMLNKLIMECNQTDFSNRYEMHYATYQNMLKFSFEYQEDPEKKNVYNRLLRDLTKLNDDVHTHLLEAKNLNRYFGIKKEVKSYFNIDENLSMKLVDEITFEKEVGRILHQSAISSGEKDASASNQIDKVFKFLWLTDMYQKAHIDMIHRLLHSESLPWQDKSLLVTAVTLSALRHFDEKKIIILFDVAHMDLEQVWHRAFIGLCLLMLFYENRFAIYPELSNRLKIWLSEPSTVQNIEIFALQYVWQKESEKIAKRINEEFLPDMMRMKTMIEEKLDLDNIVSSDPLKDKNPDWEDYLKDSPDIYKKFEDLQRLQTEGADIFMGAFSMLKRFPFFNEITHWFVPFYMEHPSVREMTREMHEKPGFEKIIKGLASSYFLCNSDKYSFCHNLRYVMQMQAPGVMEMFKNELEAMNEMAQNDELVQLNTRNKSIFTQYLQDLYRFYMLYPGRHEFENVFDPSLNLHETSFLQSIANESKIIHKIGEFYFNQNEYAKALSIFKSVEKEGKSTDLLEKIAFCHQHLGQIDEAIEAYNKALLMDKNRKWKLQQLAFCHRKKGNFKKALEYSLERERMDPDDLKVQADIGQIYLALEDYDNALKYYYKLEYLDPDNHRVQRPLAWCSFVLGKMDTAQKYLEKVLSKDKKKNKNDLLNLAHVLWCQSKAKDAIPVYKEALLASKNDFKWFETAMLEDSRHLANHGIEPLNIHLMTDYVKMV
jgi:tetratricopeptide (TPR) repeat protein